MVLGGGQHKSQKCLSASRPHNQVKAAGRLMQCWIIGFELAGQIEKECQ
jgi:hypothetical protein